MSETKFKYIPGVNELETQDNLVRTKDDKLLEHASLLEIAHQLKRIADCLS